VLVNFYVGVCRAVLLGGFWVRTSPEISDAVSKEEVLGEGVQE
jgi:hypothetical protein